MLNSYILIKNYELCSQMGHLIGLLGVGKAQFSHHIETIMIPFRVHDETEYKKLVTWEKAYKCLGLLTMHTDGV